MVVLQANDVATFKSGIWDALYVYVFGLIASYVLYV